MLDFKNLGENLWNMTKILISFSHSTTPGSNVCATPIYSAGGFVLGQLYCASSSTVVTIQDMAFPNQVLSSNPVLSTSNFGNQESSQITPISSPTSSPTARSSSRSSSSSSPVSSPTPNLTSAEHSNSSKPKTGIVVGVLVPVLLLAIIAASLLVPRYRQKHRDQTLIGAENEGGKKENEGKKEAEALMSPSKMSADARAYEMSSEERASELPTKNGSVGMSSVSSPVELSAVDVKKRRNTGSYKNLVRSTTSKEFKCPGALGL